MAYNPYPLSSNQLAAFNLNPSSQLRKYRTAVAKVKSGQANMKLLCLGDSTTFGDGSNNSGVGDLKTFCYPNQLTAMFNSTGINAHCNSFMGYGSVTFTNNKDNDPRIVVGSSWTTFGSGSPTLGATLFTASTTTNALSFTPTVNVDTFVIYYITAVGNGVLSLDINGAGGTTQSTNAANGFATVTKTGTLGTNTLNIKYSSGGAVFVLGVEAYDSTKKWIDVINSGWSGAKASDLANNGSFFAPLAAYAFLAPDLTIIMDGINDWGAGVSLSTYKTNMQTLITTGKISGDVVLVSPAPSGTAQASIATQQGFVDTMAQLSIENNVPFINWWTRMGPQASNTAMYWTANILHPNMNGYNDLSQTIFNVIGNT